MQSGLRNVLVALVLASTSVAKVVLVSVTGESFGPSVNTGNVGDEIEISFTVGSATFTQSTFDQPCVPLPGGIDSGPKIIPPGQGPQQFTFTLQTTDPLFFFNFFDQSTAPCKAGFVATINATPQQNTQFKANAENFNPSNEAAPVETSQAVSTPQTIPDSPSRPSNTPIQTSSNRSPVEISVQTHVQLGITTLPQSVPQSSTATPDSEATRVDDNAPTSVVSIIGQIPASSSSSSSSSVKSPVSSASSSLGTKTSAIPGQTSQPAPTTSSDNGTSKSKIVAAVIGALLGVITLVASVFVLIVVKRRRDRVVLLPQSYRNYPGAQDNSHSRISRAAHLLKGASARFASMFSGQRWGWNRLEENDGRRVTPFVAGVNAAHLEEKAQPFKSSTQDSERRVSESTLVPSEDTHQSNTTDISLLVHAPGSEKSIDVTDTYRGGQIDIDSYPFVLSANSERKSYPTSSRFSS